MLAFGITVLICLVLMLVLANTDNRESDYTEINSNSQNLPVSGKGGVNNPGFLRVNINVNWKGCQRPPNTEFENFETIELGIRAWFVNLFGKIDKGIITNTNSMIDVLTPAGSENPEPARQNYKAHVSRAKSWLELGKAVFDFEACPSWKSLSNAKQNEVLSKGLQLAVSYKYDGNLPQYFN